jgi:hypothetical protein
VLFRSRDEIARAQGWTLPGDKGLLIDGTSVTATAYHRIVFIEALHTHRHDKQNDHPIPDTLDAAVSVIEETGRSVTELRVKVIPLPARVCMYATSDKGRPGVEIESPLVRPTDEALKTAYREAHWKLALACVKNNSRPTRQEGKQ